MLFVNLYVTLKIEEVQNAIPISFFFFFVYQRWGDVNSLNLLVVSFFVIMASKRPGCTNPWLHLLSLCLPIAHPLYKAYL